MLSRIDLNLLVHFDALLTERNVTRAAARLGLGQSAMSHNLARLRELFGDELLTRGPDGLMLTPRALALEILRSLIERVVLQPTDTGFEIELVGEIAPEPARTIDVRFLQPSGAGALPPRTLRGGCADRAHRHRTSAHAHGVPSTRCLLWPARPNERRAGRARSNAPPNAKGCRKTMGRVISLR